MTAPTGITKIEFSPINNLTCFFVTYTKGTTTDTMDLSAYLSSIKAVFARDDSAGADDPVAWSGTTITFSLGTGTGEMLVFGVK